LQQPVCLIFCCSSRTPSNVMPTADSCFSKPQDMYHHIHIGPASLLEISAHALRSRPLTPSADGACLEWQVSRAAVARTVYGDTSVTEVGRRSTIQWRLTRQKENRSSSIHVILVHASFVRSHTT
jgi:hypothetical protein